jgi:pseudouridine-5'-phosphate glycosidase
MLNQILRRMVIHPDVRSALSLKKGVVALESTVITHGLPYPDNFNNALKLQKAVRDQGAVPAIIAVLDGIIHVGIDDEQLENLAKDTAAMKLSLRDLPMAMALGKNGGTTVATTMMIAEKANIRVFATGGIGGVHRGADQTFDISADLEELGRSDVCVVCAGAKAILDIPKTLEVLETKGVPVITYQSDQFPAFYYADSGLKSPARLDEIDEIANLLAHKWNLKNWADGLSFKGGVLIANPIEEAHSLDKDKIEAQISQALQNMTVTGKDVTPYLLAEVSRLSEGKSKESNMVLLENNAKLAAQIANQLIKTLS